MCGLPCFTRQVRRTRVPSGFKLPNGYKKFDGLQDPEDWIIDFLERVKLLGGSRATAMQSVQAWAGLLVFMGMQVNTQNICQKFQII
jgi:hypothetical protein